MKTFKHSGDMGDIIYSLPTIRALGGGILYLDPKGGESDHFIKMQCIDGRTKLNKNSIDFLTPLLKIQPYIEDVKYWNGEKVDYNLDEFRQKFADPNKRNKNANLADLHLEQFNLSPSEVLNPWISVDNTTKLHKSVIIARSPRYHGSYGILNASKFFIRDKAIFVGIPKEHEYFEWTFDIKVDYHKTETSLDLARVIKGCDLFIANASLPLSIAIGMGHPSIKHELDLKVPTCVFENLKNISYF
jgi:hypothetical protein